METIEQPTERTGSREPADRRYEDLLRHPGPKQYILVAVALALATGMEVGLYYTDIVRGVLIGLLLFFMLIKFALVVLYFMHLRFDNPIFRRLFITGMLLAMAVYLIVLTSFGVFHAANVLLGLSILAAGLIVILVVVSRLRGTTRAARAARPRAR